MAGVFFPPATVARTATVRRPALARPRQVRGIFAQAGLSGFAGFVVLGTFTAVSPAALAQLLHQRSPAMVGLVVFAVFAASAAGQLTLPVLGPRVGLPTGAAALAVGAGVIAIALASESLAALIVG